MRKGITEWKVEDYLVSSKARANYIQAAIEEEDVKVMIMAIGDVAKVVGISQIAEKTELNKTSLYRSLSGETKPEFMTIYKVLDSLDLKLCVCSK